METNQRLAAAREWAGLEFGAADLGDRRRTGRLMRLAAAALLRPGGKVTEVAARDSERQGAYGLLNNDRVSVAAIADAQRGAAARRVKDGPFAWVPCDSSSITITDHEKQKGTGRLSSRRFRARGFNVMTALVIRHDGICAGIGGQVYWTRPEQSDPRDRHDRTLEEKETRHWLTVIEQVESTFQSEGCETEPWYLLDRGGDVSELLLSHLQQDRLVTVRASYDRRVYSPTADRIREELGATPVEGIYELSVPLDTEGRRRTATIEVRAKEVTLHLHLRLENRDLHARIWAVLAREIGAPPGTEPVDWLLYTTYPVETFADAMQVIYGYSMRWRIEEFHKTWKSGACRVEETQLRDPSAILKWATILASVSARLMTIRDTSRATPNLPATELFSADEIQAAVILREPKDHVPGQVPTIGRVTRWIADIGGYTGKSSGGPPGLIVLRRGFERVTVAAETICKLRQSKM